MRHPHGLFTWVDLMAPVVAALARPVELGGRIWLPEFGTGEARFAGVADPTGGMVMLGQWPGLE